MTADGSRYLMLAIVAQAVRDLRHANTVIRLEAQAWIESDPLCEEICEYLGYELSALQRVADSALS